MIEDFAVFICTHGRPNSQHTYNALRKFGYTGKIYLVLDDTDITLPEYVNNYSEDIIVFDKQHYIDTADTAVRPPNIKTILYAKLAVEDIAKYLGLTSFVIADDDIKAFRVRYVENGSMHTLRTLPLDDVFAVYKEYLLTAGFTALGMCSNVQMIAGKSVFEPETITKFRVPYNFVFRNTSKEITWVSSYGEDIITAMNCGKIGQMMWCIPYGQIDMIPPGSCEEGGMSDMYESLSSFNLFFYDFLYNPGSIAMRQQKAKWNAHILKNNAFPKILSYTYRKET